MEKFTQRLKKIIENKNTQCSCFAINIDLKVGIKVALSSEQVHDFVVNCLNYLCDKKFSKMQLGPYPQATPKDFIETISITDERISSVLRTFLSIPVHAETNTTAMNKYNAYMIIVEIEKSKYYFFTKRNLFVAYKKKNFFYAIFAKNSYDVVTDNLIRLVQHFDCIVLGDTCYMVTIDGRSLLGLNNVARDNSLRNKERLVRNGIIAAKDLRLLDAYMSKAGQAQCLSEINEEIMYDLSHINIEHIAEISTKYRLKILTDDNGKSYVDISSKEHLKDLISTLTNKRGKNFNDETVETTAPFTKR